MREPRRHAQPKVENLSEQEIQVRLATVEIGIWVSVIVCLGAFTYALLTWDEPNRAAMMAVVGLGLATALLVRFLPLERIVRSRWREQFFFSWSALDVVFIAIVTALDGGTRSPYALFFVLPFLFGSLSYPLRVTAAVGLVSVASFGAVAVTAGGGLSYSGMGVFALFCVAFLSSWEARNQAARRAHLTASAQALAESEQVSRRQALQQEEVARFGQMALGGADVAELRDAAVAAIARVLKADIVGLLKLDEERDEFSIVGSWGLPRDPSERVPAAGHRSQAGHTLTTCDPVVVSDWRTEERFRPAPVIARHGMRSGVTVLVRGSGSPYGVLGVQSKHASWFSDEDVSFLQAMSNVLANAIERRTSEDRTRYEALHDPLTSLANRTLFLDRLEHSLSQSVRREGSVAVLFMDLDQFKMVNDSLGHAAGDELLAAVAPRLEQALRPGDTIARFGGDEFAVLVEEVGSERDATRVAERIGEVLARPFILRRREHFVSASIGISIGKAGDDPEALIRDADAALYRAKDRGRGGYEIFDEVMRSRVIDHMQTENDLRRALQRKELELHFQPIISLRDRSAVALEALIRWNHPERGLLGPAAFIPVAEESRLILPIGRWVLEEACRQAARWQALMPDSAPIGVSVNLSALQLADPELTGIVNGAIEGGGIDPRTLRLELTESTLLDDTESLERCLGSLGDLGVGIVLDDFGIGFSSLGYVKRLPLSAIKLDRTFVEHLAHGTQDVAIVRAVTEMADALNMGVVAEGVETEEQLSVVEELGCGFVQGFHFSPAVPVSEVEGLLKAPAWAPASTTSGG